MKVFLVFLAAIIFLSLGATPVAAAPPSFSDLRVSNISQTTASVTWTTSYNTDSKIAYHITSGAGTQLYAGQSDSTTAHSVMLNNLLSGTGYTVTAYIYYNGFPYSATTNFTTLPRFRVIATSAPVPFIQVIGTAIPALTLSNPSYDNLTSTSVRIHWTTNNLATSYVQYYTGPGDAAIVGQNDNVTAHTVQINNLSPNTTYSFRAKSIDQASHEAISGVDSFTTISSLIGALEPRTDNTPPRISVVEATHISQNSARISWNTNEEANSWVFYSTTATDATPVGNYENNQGTNNFTPAGIHKYTLTGLHPGTTYSYRAVSKDRSQNFGISNRKTFTTASVNQAAGNQNNQNLANQGDEANGEETSTIPEAAEETRDELLGKAPAKQNSFPSPSARADFEKAKQAVNEELKKDSGQNSSSDSKKLNIAGITGSLFALGLNWFFVGMFLLGVGLIVLGIAMLKRNGRKPLTRQRPIITMKVMIVGGVLLIFLTILMSMMPFLSGFLFSLPYMFTQNDNDRVIEQSINQK